MIRHKYILQAEVRNKIRKGDILFGGNNKLKIYGLLSCSSGKRMSPDNRVFFENEMEAIRLGYRPCGHCMKKAYLQWKDGIIRKLH